MLYPHRIDIQCFNFHLISVEHMYQFMESLELFKEFMIGSKSPNYVKRYCLQLDKFKWQWFYYQMKEPVEFVVDIEYLFYILKWILKDDFDDLGYAVYFQVIMDPEMRPKPLIKDEWLTILDKRYTERLLDDLPVTDSDQLDDFGLMESIEEDIVVIF